MDFKKQITTISEILSCILLKRGSAVNSINCFLVDLFFC